MWMLKGAIAILLILALGKPWCCCAIDFTDSVVETRSSRGGSTCCHQKQDAERETLPDGPADPSCRCKSLSGVLPSVAFSLKAPEAAVSPSHFLSEPCDAIGAIGQQTSTLRLRNAHDPPWTGPPAYLVHCVLRC